MDKLRVDPVREAYVILKRRADFFQIKAVYIIYINDRMRITHGNSSHAVFFSIDSDRRIDDLFSLSNDRDLFCSEDRGAHVDFYHGSLAIADDEIYIFNTTSCGNA